LCDQLIDVASPWYLSRGLLNSQAVRCNLVTGLMKMAYIRRWDHWDARQLELGLLCVSSEICTAIVTDIRESELIDRERNRERMSDSQHHADNNQQAAAALSVCLRLVSALYSKTKLFAPLLHVTVVNPNVQYR